MPVTRIDVPLGDLRKSIKADGELRRRIARERERLLTEAGIDAGRPHYHRPTERPFTAAERGQVTILIGGLTWKHEKFIQAVFRGSGYRCEIVPVPKVSGFQLGKEYGNNGQCNPTYFTVGNLVEYLQSLEARGLTRQEILDNYVFFTAGSCGPCRFGMYESEYRLALHNAGFDGFRVLLFKQDDGINAASGEAGLKFTVDFGMGMLNSLNLGDLVSDLAYRIRPYEVVKGETDRVLEEAVEGLAATLRDRIPFEILRDSPPWLSKRLAANKRLKDILNSLGKVREHLYGTAYREALRECRDRFNRIEVDRLRVKPAVKIVGEFWAQITEGDGNFRMFEFLEREGAQVLVEPIGTWIMYMLYQAKMTAARRKAVDARYPRPAWWEVGKRLANELNFRKKWAMLSAGEAIYARQYRRVADALGGLSHDLVSQKELGRLAHAFFSKYTRGGEGHLEVGKNIYYTVNNLSHMVLALKPFGCMPSTQSDGAQSAVANHFKDMIFLPIETSGEGEINAHSRVQMALGEAKIKARMEFEAALESTGKRLDDLRTYVAEHPGLRRPFYPVPHRHGIAGEAANFILHVNDVMNGQVREHRVADATPALAEA